jgi:hypothetical protein
MMKGEGPWLKLKRTNIEIERTFCLLAVLCIGIGLLSMVLYHFQHQVEEISIVLQEQAQAVDYLGTVLKYLENIPNRSCVVVP